MASQQTYDITHDHELDVLSQIHHNQKVKQRDIAHAIGLSLGMTNAILKRLAAKGFIAMRKINSRNIHYLVTTDGVELIARRSYRYLRRTVGHVVRYKERMLEILEAAAAPPPVGQGVTGVVLVGESDLEFLVEWCAEKTGLSFRKQADAGFHGRTGGRSGEEGTQGESSAVSGAQGSRSDDAPGRGAAFPVRGATSSGSTASSHDQGAQGELLREFVVAGERVEMGLRTGSPGAEAGMTPSPGEGAESPEGDGAVARMREVPWDLHLADLVVGITSK